VSFRRFHPAGYEVRSSERSQHRDAGKPVFGLWRTRSYWDFYQGLGLGTTIFLTAEGIVFWQLSSLAKKDAKRLRSILWVFLTAYLAFAAHSYTHFFYGPVITEILIAASLLKAIATATPALVKQRIPVRSEAHSGD